MYKLAVLVSTISTRNVFRGAVISAFAAPHHSNFLICSGFFHERNPKKGPFYASHALINARTVFPVPSSITTVGAYNPACKEYKIFGDTIRANIKTTQGSSVRVRQRYASRKWHNRWHAKIFIAAEGRIPRFAVVGSSNLTRSAFGPSPLNNESDVIIWDDSHVPTRVAANSALTMIDDQQPGGTGTQVIIANYDPGDSRNSSSLPMDRRLAQLWRDILAVTRQDA